MRMIDALERADVMWCAIGGIAVNHWANEPMVTRDVDIVVAATEVERAVSALRDADFEIDRFKWSVNFKGCSHVSIQLSTEACYLEFASRSVPADVHGILMRVATPEDTLEGKVRAWRDPGRRKSKRFKDLGDIARLVEAIPHLSERLPDDAKRALDT